MTSLAKAFCSATLLNAVALPAMADEVTLVFKESNLALTGELKTTDADGYVIVTEVGEIHVPVTMVECEGTSCPTIALLSVDG